MGLIGLPEMILILVVALFYSDLIKSRKWLDPWAKQQGNSRRLKLKPNERSKELENLE